MGTQGGITLKTLSDTVFLMESAEYKNRFVGEYLQLRIRIDKLNKFLAEYRVKMATGESIPYKCTYNMLEDQLCAMEQYRQSLEERAIVEDIDVWSCL